VPTERTPQPLEPEVSRTLRVAAAAVGLPMWLLVPDEMVKGDGAEAWEPGSTTAHPQAQCLTAAGAAGVRVGRKDCQRHSHWSFLHRSTHPQNEELKTVSREACVLTDVRADGESVSNTGYAGVEVQSQASVFVRRADGGMVEVKANDSTTMQDGDTVYLVVRSQAICL
jgi:hypothetical protein